MTLNKAALASTLLGVGPGGGGLQKLTISHDGTDFKENGPIEALFNPHEISRSRSVSWEAPKTAGKGSEWTWTGLQQEFSSMEPATLSIELFFDTYESRASASAWAQVTSFVVPPNPFQRGDATDVTALTGRVAGLAEVDTELHRPPGAPSPGARSPRSSPVCSPASTSGSRCSCPTAPRCGPPSPAVSSSPSPTRS